MEEQEKAKRRSLKEWLRESELFSGFFLFCLMLTLLSLAIYITARFSMDFAEFFSRYPASYLRAATGTITSIIPFSIAEFVLLMSPAIAVAYIISASAAMKKDTGLKMFIRKLKPPLCAVMLILSSFVLSFATAYFRNPLDENININKQDVSKEELALTARIINDELETLMNEINFVYEGSSYMPYSYNALTEKINDAYSKFSQKNEFLKHFTSSPKPVALSVPMTYTQIAGVYTFFTGEANVNMNYPDYVIPFTVAHEMAHQRGIAREDEANLLAFLVSMESNDPYIRYSALINIQQYVFSALKSSGSEEYSAIYHGMPDEVKGEFKAYSVFFEKYKNKSVSKVTTAVNNVFLQSQGQSAGIKSYGLVVDSIVAYYNDAE